MCIYTRMKNRFAPIECADRVDHPVSEFREMFMTDSNVICVKLMKCIEIRTPVIICSPRHVANIDPMFHKYEMFLGVGRSTIMLLISIRMSFFRFWVFILFCYFYGVLWVFDEFRDYYKGVG